MNEEQIARINALARKAKSPEGLTPEEKTEQARLRAEYVAAFRNSIKAQLDAMTIVEPDGTARRLNTTLLQ